MNWKYVLLEYDYIQYCQGSRDRGHGTALIHCPEDCSFENIKNTFFKKKNRNYFHEIDINSVVDATIEW